MKELAQILLMLAASLEWPQLLNNVRTFEKRKRLGNVRVSAAASELAISSLKLTCYLVAQVILIPDLGWMPCLVSVGYSVFHWYKVHAWLSEVRK